MTAPNTDTTSPLYAGKPSRGTPYGLYWGGLKGTKAFQQGLSQDIVGRTQREQNISGLFDNALANPTGTADLFGKYFQQAAEGYSAPALRDFTGAIQGVSANTARRFGGNASTEENRQVSGAGDMFSRNLTEALARLAPEQVAAGQAYTNELGQAQSAAAGQSDTLKSLLLASLQSTVNTGNGLDVGKILGQIAGTIGGTLIGGPAGGAIGSKIGSELGGDLSSEKSAAAAGGGSANDPTSPYYNPGDYLKAPAYAPAPWETPTSSSPYAPTPTSSRYY